MESLKDMKQALQSDTLDSANTTAEGSHEKKKDDPIVVGLEDSQDPVFVAMSQSTKDLKVGGHCTHKEYMDNFEIRKIDQSGLQLVAVDVFGKEGPTLAVPLQDVSKLSPIKGYVPRCLAPDLVERLFPSSLEPTWVENDKSALFISLLNLYCHQDQNEKGLAFTLNGVYALKAFKKNSLLMAPMTDYISKVQYIKPDESKTVEKIKKITMPFGNDTKHPFKILPPKRLRMDKDGNVIGTAVPFFIYFWLLLLKDTRTFL